MGRNTRKYTVKTPPEHKKGIVKIPIREDLQTIRTHSQLNKTIHKQPQIEHMITKEYTKEETQQETRKLSNKSHGTDDIPGDAYKSLVDWIAPRITTIMQKIQQGDKIPPGWTQGAVSHIYKNKGDIRECKN